MPAPGHRPVLAAGQHPNGARQQRVAHRGRVVDAVGAVPGPDVPEDAEPGVAPEVGRQAAVSGMVMPGPAAEVAPCRAMALDAPHDISMPARFGTARRATPHRRLNSSQSAASKNRLVKLEPVLGMLRHSDGRGREVIVRGLFRHCRECARRRRCPGETPPDRPHGRARPGPARGRASRPGCRRRQAWEPATRCRQGRQAPARPRLRLPARPVRAARRPGRSRRRAPARARRPAARSGAS